MSPITRILRALVVLPCLAVAIGVMAADLPCRVPDPAVPLTLAAAMRHALCAHPDTHEAWAHREASEADVEVARAAWRPGLSVEGRTAQSGDTVLPDDNNVSALGIHLAWLLFDGGARAGARDAALAARAARFAAHDDIAQRVLANAAQAWLGAGSAQATRDAALANESRADAAHRAAQARRAAGSATLGDALQTKAALAQAQLARVRAEAETETARGALARAIGLPASHPLRLAPLPEADALPMSDLRALIEAARLRPDLVGAAARVTEAEAETRRLAAGNRPRITLSAGEELNREDNDGNVASSLSLTLSWPFYDGGATRSRAQAARFRAQAAAARRESLALEAELEVWRAWHRLQAEGSAVTHAHEALIAAEHAERAQFARYKAGLSDIVALLSAQAALAEARRQDAQVRFSHQQARVELARAAGQLDPARVQEPFSEPTSAEAQPLPIPQPLRRGSP